MEYQTIAVRPLTPACGAEITGVDLSRTLSERQFAEVHEALLRHCVIFFREQRMSVDQHKAFGRRFGRLHVHPNAPQELPGHPEILVIKANKDSKRVAGEAWHSDVSCDAEPPMGSILHIHQAPQGGDTMFASMYAAYDALSEPVKRLLQGLTAEHDSAKAHPYRRGATDRADMHFPCHEHPVVRKHPVTGRQALFVDRGFTTRIPALARHESDALLEMLFRHIETPHFHCRFRWEDNSVAFWDNRCAQHMAIWDYWPQERYGYRVTICGDRPV
jgi:taurine dioxygenase